jgi:hypothetical protein
MKTTRRGILRLAGVYPWLALAFVLGAGGAVGRASEWATRQQSAPATPRARQAEPPQRTFATPEEARDALVAAVAGGDHAALAAIFGPEHHKLHSGDPVEDERHRKEFAEKVAKTCDLVKADDNRYTLTVGDDKFPFPIPLVKDGERWRYDTRAGLEEILNRRIGEDELSAIMTCRAYVLAQWEYFTQSGSHNEDGLAEYAQRFVSTPGNRDGLYWDTKPGDDPSPLGPLVAAARAEGYGPGSARRHAHVQSAKSGTGPGGDSEQGGAPRSPYHGYYFKILTRQGASAPGGAFSYLINGHMIAGFGLVAYPAKWGNSGVMTFIVNTQGRVYQKNLGATTAEIAPAMSTYDPDPSWTLAPKE